MPKAALHHFWQKTRSLRAKDTLPYIKRHKPFWRKAQSILANDTISSGKRYYFFGQTILFLRANYTEFLLAKVDPG